MGKKLVFKGSINEVQKIATSVLGLIKEGKIQYLDIGSDEEKTKGRITVVFKDKKFTQLLDVPKSKNMKIPRFFRKEEMEVVNVYSYEKHRDREVFFGHINYAVNHMNNEVHSLIFTSGETGENITAICCKNIKTLT